MEGDNFDYVSWLKKVQVLLISHNINKKIPFGSKNWTGRPTCHNQTCLIGRLVAGRG
jgi:hypothetical protein